MVPVRWSRHTSNTKDGGPLFFLPGVGVLEAGSTTSQAGAWVTCRANGAHDVRASEPQKTVSHGRP